MQKQYTERPYKVLGEPYDAAASPLQAGVCVCTDNPLGWTDGVPHVHAATGMVHITAGQWIVEDLWTHAWAVMSDEEFSARFGGNLAAEG
jgi:hypothetical protein